MTLEEIIFAFRKRVFDGVAPFLWSDEEVALFADDAVNEACIRARLIEDKTTPAVCSIPLVIATSSYLLHPSIFAIKRITCRSTVLNETSVEELDLRDAYWETRISSPPREYIYGQGTTLRVFPMPAAIDPLALTVYRIPLLPLTADDTNAAPEIPAHQHMRLLDWICYRAYSKEDTETFNADKAARYEAKFIESFGIRSDANVLRKQRDKRPPRVAFRW